MAVTARRRLDTTTTRRFGSGREAYAIPDLTEIQTKSYARFLQYETTHDKRKSEGLEGYHIKPTESELRGEGDPFPEPNWPTESLDALVAKTFDGRMILGRDSPAWRRLVGLRQKLS